MGDLISVAWAIFKASPIARWLAKIGGLVLLVLGLRAKWRRDGANEQEAEHKAEAAEAHQKTIEEVLRETPSDDPADTIRDRLRKRAGKP